MLHNLQEGGDAYIKKEGKEMIVAMTLERPLEEAQRFVQSPDAFLREILRTIEDAKSHPVIAQMLRPGVRDDLFVPHAGHAKSFAAY